MSILFLYKNIKGFVIVAPVYLVLFLYSTSFLFCQQDDFIRSLLSGSDIKKLDKTKDYEILAEKLVEEANELYMETFAVQGNYDLDEKAISKKVKQLESKAQKKQLEATKYYELINSAKFGIYKKYIEKFWSEFEGDESAFINAKLIEEQSNDFYFQAKNLRSEAIRTQDNKEKLEKLNNAYELEIKSLDKQLNALSIYYSMDYTAGNEFIEPVTPVIAETQVPETEPEQEDVYYDVPIIQETETSPPITEIIPVIPSGTAVEGDIRVNQMIIDIYDRYMEDETKFPSTVLTPEILAGLTSFDADKIKNIWYSYAYDTLYEGIPEPPAELVAISDTITGEMASVDQTTDVVPEEIVPGEYEERISVVDEEIGESYHIPADEQVIYRVQIAANKMQLSQRSLSKIYFGNKRVEMINEEGWFKYSIGDFDTYEGASKFRKQCGVKNAFIVAYRKGTRFTAGGIDETGITSISESAEGMITSKYNVGLSFRVQIAANRVPMTKDQLKRIYKDNYPIELINEEGWYKYQLLGVRLFSDALKILRNAEIKGAFIIAYNNNTKHNLHAAVKRSKSLEKEVQTYGRKGKLNDIEWHVQIAASRIGLSQNELSQIYSGNENISLIIEDGWYKYRLKAGTSYSTAAKIKQECGIEKAFIVAYYIGKKVPLYKAINEY